MRICIVGASGKLGKYMVQHALDRAYEVAGGEHEAGSCPRRGSTAVMEKRSVQASPWRCLQGGLGSPAVGGDPCDDRL
jgi:putative NADH-flavin reductase